MSNLKVYRVTAKTNPFDWASTPRHIDVGFYRTRESAEVRVQEMMEHPDFHMDFSDVWVSTIEVME